MAPAGLNRQETSLDFLFKVDPIGELYLQEYARTQASSCHWHHVLQQSAGATFEARGAQDVLGYITGNIGQEMGGMDKNTYI